MTAHDLATYLQQLPPDYHVYPQLPDRILTPAQRRRLLRLPLLPNAAMVYSIAILGPLSPDEHAELEVRLRAHTDNRAIQQWLAPFFTTT